jgi:putative membrane protein
MIGQRTTTKLSLALAAAALLTTGAFAPQTAMARNGHAKWRAPMDRNDSAFMKKVNGANLGEMLFSPLVARISSNSGARRFAEQMTTDHTMANNELKMLARRKGVLLPGMAPASARAAYNRLARLRGHNFDVAYQNQMIADHNGAVALFESEVRSGHDAQVRAFATKLLPTLRHHLRMAKSMLAHRM